MIIRRIQRPENLPAQSGPPAATPAVDSSTSSLPLPANAVPQAPIILPPNQDIIDNGDDGRQDIGMLYPRFLFVLLGSFFVSLHAASWPPFLRGLFVNTVVLLANSYWVPQIHRNVIRGCRKAFTWEFVIGMSICRVVPALYLYCWKGNIFFLEPSYKSAAIVLGWVWFQVFLLLSQQLFGPRVLIPSNVIPPHINEIYRLLIRVLAPPPRLRLPPNPSHRRSGSRRIATSLFSSNRRDRSPPQHSLIRLRNLYAVRRGPDHIQRPRRR